MRAWKDLPNAQHIDWVIDSVKQHPGIWAAAYDSNWCWPWQTGPERTAQLVVWGSGRVDTWNAAQVAARNAALYATRVAARNAARVVGTSAILALIAYDDCAHLLDMPSDRLKIWAMLSEQPAAMLLLPAVIAHEHIAKLDTV
jgi:hypothetical protein